MGISSKVPYLFLHSLSAGAEPGKAITAHRNSSRDRFFQGTEEGSIPIKAEFCLSAETMASLGEQSHCRAPGAL